MKIARLFALSATACLFAAASAENVWLTALDLSKVHQGYGKPQIDKNIVEKPISIAGVHYDYGLGTHAVMRLDINVNGAKRFKASVGVDDSAAGQPGSVTFSVYGDAKLLAETAVMRPGQAAQKIDVDLAGVKKLILMVGAAGDGIAFDHADWADAKFEVDGKAPTSFEPPTVKPYILTPKPGPKPRINGAKVFGVRPGHPVLYTIPATGDRPMKFGAEGLPAGLKVDEATGQLSGSTATAGEYPVTFTATNAKGTAKRPFKFVVGDTLALTPPMGWSTWYMAYTNITQDFVKSEADAMVSTGLINHGFTYINIDDGWNVRPGDPDAQIGGAPRDADGNLVGNRNFRDIKGMCDYVHAKGLKIGIYISPGKTTCAGFEGSFRHEEQDARQFAKWGFDFLKYDWCSYGAEAKNDSVEEYQKPYKLMGDILKRQSRDFVYNLCQYGMGDVWKWGRQVGGNFWRTTGDLGNAGDGPWAGMSGIGFGQAGYDQYAGPGGWNDPDNILIGCIMYNGKLQPCGLTPDEQYTYVSLWAILAAPMVLACDMTQLDSFTLSLLSNDEVIDVNQDTLGKAARRVHKDGDLEVWVKDLEDGSKAVGLFNRSLFVSPILVNWSDVGVSGKQVVRDLWRQRNVGLANGSWNATVPSHGVVLLKLTPVK